MPPTVCLMLYNKQLNFSSLGGNNYDGVHSYVGHWNTMVSRGMQLVSKLLYMGLHHWHSYGSCCTVGPTSPLWQLLAVTLSTPWGSKRHRTTVQILADCTLCKNNIQKCAIKWALCIPHTLKIRCTTLWNISIQNSYLLQWRFMLARSDVNLALVDTGWARKK